MTRVRVVVLPVYQRHWVFHAWTEGGRDIAQDVNLDWKAGKNIKEKVELLGHHLSAKATVTARDQWEKLKVAEPNTFRGTVYRFAQWALSKEDPLESFFRAVPQQAARLEIIYPTSINPNLVRRRLRMLSLTREQYHNRQILGWTLASLPQMPLVISPFPNVTLYYTVYKVWSNHLATKGCATLKGAFKTLDEAHLTLYEATRKQRRGKVTQEQLIAEAKGALVPVFVPSKELDKLVRPLDRWDTPLPDSAAEGIRKLFQQTDSALTDVVARARSQILAKVT